MARQDFKNFGSLVKWPQCVIVGETVTKEQAREILLRTDGFFHGYGSNDTEWDKKIWSEIGLPIWNYYETFDIDKYQKYEHDRQCFSKKHKLLKLEYLGNNYISTCFISGPHGWCHPDGKIHFWDNIGKWPCWDGIYGDCKTLAKAFPFLNIKVYLFNQENNCEEYYDYQKKCVGGFKIKNGRVYKLKIQEFLDPHAPECYSPYNGDLLSKIKGDESLESYINQQKTNIFGDKANVTEWRESRGERFFTIEEFREYFGKLLY